MDYNHDNDFMLYNGNCQMEYPSLVEWLYDFFYCHFVQPSIGL